MAPKQAHEKYKRLDLIEHVYERPGMYVGSVEPTPTEMYVYEEGKMMLKTATIVPGLLKIINEATTNALDHVVRMKKEIAEGKEDARPVKNIRISADMASGWVEVMNDGDAPDAIKHPDYDNVWVPELLFGNMHTSTNYDKNEERLGAGQNGVGIALTACLSKEFLVDLVDHRHRKHYTQRFFNNLREKEAPKVKACAKTPYTKVRFLPDYQRFGLSGMTPDIHAAIQRMAYDAAACSDATVAVYFNDQKVEVKDFPKYADLFLPDKSECPRVYERCNDRWEVVAALAPRGVYEQVSFVNGNYTAQGGKHVENVTNAIVKALADLVKSKKKQDVKPQHLRDNLMVFVKCTIPNPEFNSQAKEYLTTPASKFGSKCDLSDKFITALFKSPIVENALSLNAAVAEKALKKTDGKKTSRVLVPKLNDANLAGTKHSPECTLMLVEGDSAASMAIAGLSVVGRDYYGVFPLKGKPLNVKDAQAAKISQNEEITAIKKILGLEQGKVYTDVSQLRYGRIMLLCDADHDGSHIKGLLMNLLQSLWPSLYKMDGFAVTMLTPMIKATHKRSGESISFYNMTDYEKWQRQLTAASESSWHIKYYKGLGTSTETEAKDYFREMRLLKYRYMGKTSDDAIDLAFNKKRADDRKEWLMAYDRGRVLDYAQTSVPYEEFIHKELIHFSNRDLERSIPSICDGLKESLRKILYGCFKRRLFTQEIRVAQLAGYISEATGYHHGEASLQGAIVGMAQIFVGAGNINLLQPNGQFGSRLQGGKDSASPRYIHTLLSPLARTLFREEDFPVYRYMDDDGVQVEPEWYCPVVPLVLINGALGIGTGFSTAIPCHNPADVVHLCHTLIAAIDEASGPGSAKSDDLGAMAAVVANTPLADIKPWYLGFQGSIFGSGDNSYASKGVYHWVDDQTVEVTELPVGVWTADYQQLLTEMILNSSPYLKDFTPQYTAQNVRFLLKLYPGAKAKLGAKFEAEFKLVTTKGLSMNNIHLYGAKGAIRRYTGVADIVQEWAMIRLETYLKRKTHLLGAMDQEFKTLSAKCRFIQDIIDGRIKVNNRPIKDVVEQLQKLGYPTLRAEADGKEGGDAGDAGAVDTGAKGYTYLVRMPIHHLTLEKKSALEKEAERLAKAMKDLKATPIQALWRKELHEFQEAWNAHRAQVEAEYEADRNGAQTSAAPKRRRATASATAKKAK